MKKNYFSQEQEKIVRNILQCEGFNSNQIEAMLESYKEYTDYEADEILRKTPSFKNEISSIDRRKILNEKYYIQKTSGSLKQDVTNMHKFYKFLKRSHLTSDQAISINNYTECKFTKILRKKRKEENVDNFFEIAFDKFMENVHASCKQNNETLNEWQIEKITNFLQTFNYFDDENFDRISNFAKYNNLPKNVRLYIENFVEEISDHLSLRKSIKNLDAALKSKLPSNMILYRGVNQDFIDDPDRPINKNLKWKGSSIEEKGYLSTSLTPSRSFADIPHNVILKLFVPKGTQGLDIIAFSHNQSECEYLLNSCDLFFIDYRPEEYTIYDQYDNIFSLTHTETHPTFIVLVLSKNRECYNDLSGKKYWHKNDVESELC